MTFPSYIKPGTQVTLALVTAIAHQADPDGREALQAALVDVQKYIAVNDNGAELIAIAAATMIVGILNDIEDERPGFRTAVLQHLGISFSKL